ncbi:MAG: disulfide bond formation protein DsbB [Yoonia sp.]|jgi:disulfide bond formation protein DsbB
MTKHQLTSLAAFGSFALLGGAYIFQALGYPPCQMCFWQRWPHMAAIGIGILAFFIPARIWPWLGAVAAAITSGIGVFHSGVERGYWPGPSSCTGSGLDAMDGADLLSMTGDKLIMCDQVSWALLGLSMASWNALLSFGLMLIWLAAARKK